MKDFVLKHKKGVSVFVCLFLIFIGCFGFPIYNFSPDAPQISRWINVLVCIAAYYEIGTVQAALYESKNWRKASLIVLIMTILGLLCRYLLEFGEVSNIYNFTLPNVLLHLIAAVCISGFAFSYTHGDY